MLSPDLCGSGLPQNTNFCKPRGSTEHLLHKMAVLPERLGWASAFSRLDVVYANSNCCLGGFHPDFSHVTPSAFRNTKAVAWRTLTTRDWAAPVPCSCFADNLAHFLLGYIMTAFLAHESSAVFFPVIFLYHLYFPQSPCSKQTPGTILCF